MFSWYRDNQGNKAGFRIGNRLFYASRCPWQVKTHASLMCDPEMVGKKYGWGSGKKTNRFGGGWSYKFGLQIGGSTVILDWGWGSFCTRKVDKFDA